MNHCHIRLETPADHRVVEELTREAFWNVYKPGCDEHYFVHTMRTHPDFLPELAFVLENNGRIIGNVMYTKAHLEDQTGSQKEILSMGPICIAPEHQRRGLSRLLLEHSFRAARNMGYDVVVNFGNPANYVGRGYVSCRKKNVCLGEGIFPTALLVKELVPDVLEGRTWRFLPNDADAPCGDLAAVAAFDADFPPKEKAWQPSQEEFYIYSHSCVVR